MNNKNINKLFNFLVYEKYFLKNWLRKEIKNAVKNYFKVIINIVLHIKMFGDVARTVFRRKCTHLNVFNKKFKKKDINEKTATLQNSRIEQSIHLKQNRKIM